METPHTEMVQNASGWALRINGKEWFSNESYQVLSNIEHALRTSAQGTTEADEVAGNILLVLARKRPESLSTL